MADFSYTGMMEFDGLKVSDEAACHVYKVGHSCHQASLQAFNTFIHSFLHSRRSIRSHSFAWLFQVHSLYNLEVIHSFTVET
jgi:hypothetical protein